MYNIIVFSLEMYNISNKILDYKNKFYWNQKDLKVYFT